MPPGFPVAVADHLRAAGLELTVDAEAFVRRRRRKTGAQLDGIRRAQQAADAAMGVAARLIRELGEGVRSEDVRAAMQAACDAEGAELPDDVIVSHGPQSAVGHEAGHGELVAGEPVVVDIWPRDKASRCWADMTRTFVAGGGEPPDELAEYWRLAKESLERVYPEVRAGADCRDALRALVRAVPRRRQADAAHQGARHGARGRLLPRARPRRRARGPRATRASAALPDTLMAGDVITLEPGCYRRGFGGAGSRTSCVVTEDGCEVLTDFPYDL